MRVSVVLSTYNGNKYIIEQLDSIRFQTYYIDEVIISDDSSTDNTADIVKNYIDKYELSNWEFTINETNIGWKRNFVKLLQKATGDYIFPCDQDDIWNKDKIEKMISIAFTNKTQLLVSSYSSFNMNGDTAVFPSHRNYSEEIRKLDFKDYPLYVKWPGCTYCINKDLIKYYSKYSFDGYPHDAFLFRTAAILDGLYLFDSSTISYRRHNNTATGRESKTLSYRIDELDYYQKVLNSEVSVVQNEDVQNKDEKLTTINRYKKWCMLRKKAVINKDKKSLIRLLLYINCYWGIKSFFSDILMCIGMIK